MKTILKYTSSFLLFLFLLNCSTTDMSKNSKFRNLWKEPSEPPPHTALLPESNTILLPKKK